MQIFPNPTEMGRSSANAKVRLGSATWLFGWTSAKICYYFLGILLLPLTLTLSHCVHYSLLFSYQLTRTPTFYM